MRCLPAQLLAFIQVIVPEMLLPPCKRSVTLAAVVSRLCVDILSRRQALVGQLLHKLLDKLRIRFIVGIIAHKLIDEYALKTCTQ